MQSKPIAIAAIVMGLGLSGSAMAATPSPTMLGNTCAGCHGTYGVSTGPATPTIAGNSAEYMIEAMKAYKSGDRPSTIMGRIAKGYNDAEIEAMAKYFAGQKYALASQKSSASMAKKGAKLHDKYCEKCHSEGGTLAEDESGFLGGQWKLYTQYSLEDFMSGKREMTKKMKKKLKKMHKKAGDKGIAEVIEYYASQK